MIYIPRSSEPATHRMPSFWRLRLHQRLAEGHTIGMAIETGLWAAPDFDSAANLALLGEANIVVRLRNKDTAS